MSSSHNGDSSKSSSTIIDNDIPSVIMKGFNFKHSTDSDSSKSSSHDDGSNNSSPSDLASTIRNKVDSIIKNSLHGFRHDLFGFSDIGGF
jgi:hypothetical protein